MQQKNLKKCFHHKTISWKPHQFVCLCLTLTHLFTNCVLVLNPSLSIYKCKKMEGDYESAKWYLSIFRQYWYISSDKI